MTSKEEIEFYETIYLLTFGKEKNFFLNSNFITICRFLNENYWGDNLILRIRLLSKLLYYDAIVSPKKIKNELIRKSQELGEILKNPE
ncbi:MAG: hypothetical protein LBJ72_07770 [Dysgonamonadaceae bacterium]|jgi:hypothetical protein|nr:hypothetical protein [Dysgonamonadaceae bacterium]